MVFDHLRATIRSRTGNRRSQTALSNLNFADDASTIAPTREDTSGEGQETVFERTMNILNHIKKSPSEKEIELPAIRRMPPISMSTFMDPESLKVIDESKQFRRKPVAVAPAVPKPVLSFDPSAPVTDPLLHLAARAALKRRYQSKFTINFEPPAWVRPEEYNFMWASEEELDRKVLADIVWVRERFSQAKREEPTDSEIVRWYDAEAFLE